MNFVVAVDGPAGSGKGTITKRVEKELGLMNLDTGITYRCLTLQTIRKGLNIRDEDKIIDLLDNINIEILKQDGKDVVLLNGEDVTDEIRSVDVTQIVSPVSSIIPVREKMVELQRKLTQGKNVIAEGRDIGTVVFPNADVKIYLDASSEIRAERRQKQNEEMGIESTYKEVLASIIERDENDKNKKVGALKQAEDAIYIDASEMTIDQVVNRIKEIILDKRRRLESNLDGR